MAITTTWPASLIASLCLGLLTAGSLGAERPVALNELQPSDSPRKAPADREADKLSKADEEAALAFVKQHHGELANLLRVLRTMNEPQYLNAIRDLNRNRLRLEQFRRRSQQRYELELHAWQVKSRIQLMTARLHMNDTPSLRKELLAAFQEQAELRRQSLKTERERLQERLTKLDEQLHRVDETDPEQQLKQLLNKLDETKRSGNKPNRSVKPAKQ